MNTQYDDVIGVWVNGTRATVSVGDGTASISNINNGETQNIFNDNLAHQFNTEMDGFIVTLTFTAPITPGAINTLKIGFAYVGNSGYDTNLLIAGGRCSRPSLPKMTPSYLAKTIPRFLMFWTMTVQPVAH